MLWSVLATILLVPDAPPAEDPQPVAGPYCSIDWREKDGDWFYGQFVYPEAMADMLVEDLKVKHKGYKFYANCPHRPPMS